MNIQDPISDMLICIKNSQLSNKKYIYNIFSNIKLNIIKILEREGFINKYQIISEYNKLFIKIYLKYFKNKPVIENIIRISKPSLRIYIKKNKIPKYKHNFGIYIISTSKGLYTDKEIKIKGLGGELLCYIY